MVGFSSFFVVEDGGLLSEMVSSGIVIVFREFLSKKDDSMFTFHTKEKTFSVKSR